MRLKNERKLEEIVKIYRTEMDNRSVLLHAGRLIRSLLSSLQYTGKLPVTASW